MNRKNKKINKKKEFIKRHNIGSFLFYAFTPFLRYF